jgi:Phage integrase central domain/Arm DNA-binding domain
LKLSQNVFDALDLPKGKTDHFVWDDSLPGFGVRLRRAAGGPLKSWIVQYRNSSSKTRRVTFKGALKHETARTEAKKLLGLVAAGKDPAAERVEKKRQDQSTLLAVAELFLAAKDRGEGKPLRPATLYERRRYLTDDYFASLHATPISAITLQDVAAALARIQTERGNTTCRHARIALSGLFQWAMKRGIAAHNPVALTEKPEEVPRDHVITPAELRAIWLACAVDDPYGQIVRLLILTVARRAEIGGLRWSEIDRDAGVITLPARRTKTGEARKIPITPMMADILDGIPRAWSGASTSSARPPLAFAPGPRPSGS